MINSHCHMAIIVVMIWSAGYQNVPCVLGLAYKLQSLVKGKSHYAVMGVYSPTDKGKCAVSENKSLILPCGVKTITFLTEKIPDICSPYETQYVGSKYNRSNAKTWAQWWCRSTPLKMLCKALADMDTAVWDGCPTTTNVVKQKN